MSGPASLALGLDVGGTKILACVVGPEGELVASRTRPTPEDADGILAAVRDACAELLEGAAAIRSVGLSVAGWVDRGRRSITFSPHLPWRGEPIADRLAQHLGLPVALENDANAAAWAEFRFGAGRQATSMLLVTIGTGVGSGLVIDRRLVRGANGMAGEVGHTTLDPDGPPCPCGRRGCLDMYSSGRALERTFDRLTGHRLPGREISTLVEEGDGDALAAFEAVGGALGRGIAETVMAIDPDVVAIGGGLSLAGEHLRGPVERALHESLGPNSDPSRLRLTVAELGPNAGAVGAADLSRDGSAPA